jgi:hypothetical protein
MLTQKQISLAARIDIEVKKLESEGLDDVGVFVGMGVHMPLFGELLHAGEKTMDELCERYDGFFRFAKILEMIADGIRSGEIEVPRDDPGNVPPPRPDNVHTLLPRLTISRPFVEDFLEEDAPCFAMCIVEERKKQRALLAFRSDEIIPVDVTSGGFNFGHSVLGTSDFELIHFSFVFYGFRTYNALVNPANANVKAVLKLMMESKEYFFFAINPGGSVTAFKAGMDGSELNLDGITMHKDRIHRSKTTQQQYDKAVATFIKKPEPKGTMLDWVCRDKDVYLDLSSDVIEMKPS